MLKRAAEKVIYFKWNTQLKRGCTDTEPEQNVVYTEKSELQGEMREKFCEEIDKIIKYNDLEIIINVI